LNFDFAARRTERQAAHAALTDCHGEEATMPFDGAEFFRKPIASESLPTDTAPEEAWYRRLKALVRRRHTTLFRTTPEDPDLAALQLLEEARRAIEQRDRWVQGVYETFGRRYCAAGALRAVGRRVRGASVESRAYKMLLEVANRRGFLNVEIMNDRSTHDQVLSAFDEAIATARQRTAAYAG
jgi:hypothetical protein